MSPRDALSSALNEMYPLDSRNGGEAQLYKLGKREAFVFSVNYSTKRGEEGKRVFRDSGGSQNWTIPEFMELLDGTEWTVRFAGKDYGPVAQEA